MRRSSALALVLAAGCALPPGPWDAAVDLEARSLPPEVTAEPGREVTVDLPTVLRLARARSLDVAYVRQRAREAAAHALAGRLGLVPRVTVGVTQAGRFGAAQNTDGSFIDVDKSSTLAAAGIAAEWSLGDAVYSLLAAEQRAQAALGAVAAARDGAALRAGLAYVDLVEAGATAALVERARAVAESLARQTRAKVLAGVGFQGDVLRVEAQVARLDRDRHVALARLGRAQAELGAALGLPSATRLLPFDAAPVRLALVPPAPSEEALVERAVRSRPELEALRHELAAAEHELTGRTWGWAIPQVAVDLTAGAFGSGPASLDGVVDYRLFLGWRFGAGADVGQREVASARLQSLRVEAARTRLAVARDVVAAAREAASLRDASLAAERAASAAREAVGLYRQRQTSQVGQALEIFLAEEAAFRADLELVAAVAAEDRAQLRLLRAAGSEGAGQ